MKCIRVLVAALACLPGVAVAQSYGEPGFSGIKIGVSVDRRRYEGEYDLPQIASTLDAERNGIGYRGHVGVDAQVGYALVVGAEGGIGGGGRSIHASSPIGDYTLKPRWTWDVSGRVGVLPVRNMLVYGRAGYGWLRGRETTDFRDANLEDVRSSGTDAGFLWGAGAEAALSSGTFARAEYVRNDYGDGLTASRIQLGMSLGF